MRNPDTLGISLEQFVDRIENSGSIVKAWPFSNMANDERYTATFSPTAVGLAVPDHTKAVTIGQVVLDEEQIWLDVRDTTEYRLRLTADNPRQTSAWEQVVSVRVALQVALGPADAESSRDAHALRVLGVEQPLKTPKTISSKRYSGRKAHSQSGYIQGAVRDVSESSHNARVYIGKDTSEAILFYDNAQLQSPRGTIYEHRLNVGDNIRSRVTRGLSPTVFRPSEGVVYVLKP